MKSISLTPRREFIFYGALPFGGHSHLVKSIFWTPRRAKLFFTVLSLWWSRSCGPRGTSLFDFPSGGCSLLGEVVVFDPEADLFFTV